MQSEIPYMWKKGTIADIAFINPKTNQSKLSDNSLVTFLSMSDIGENGRILSKQVRKYKDVKQGFTCFVENDIIFAKITPCMENGKGAFAADLCNGIGFGSTEFHILRAKESGNPKFIYHTTQSKKLRLRAEGYMTGSAGQQRVPKDFFYDYPILIPPFPEQEKIASILQSVDNTIFKTKELIEKYKMIKQGLMQGLFTRGVNEDGRYCHNLKRNGFLGKIPVHWNAVSFKDICNVSQGLQIAISKRFSQPGKNRFKYITIQYLNSPNPERVAEYIENPPKSVICNKEDILMTRTGNTGQVITNQHGVFHNNFFIIKYDKKELIKEFVIYYLTKTEVQNEIRLLAGLTTIPDLNHGDFLRIPFVYPPSKDEQQRIINILTSIDNKIQSEQAYFSKLTKIKTGLMQDLLTGKVRVKVEECQENSHM